MNLEKIQDTVPVLVTKSSVHFSSVPLFFNRARGVSRQNCDWDGHRTHTMQRPCSSKKLMSYVLRLWRTTERCSSQQYVLRGRLRDSILLSLLCMCFPE